jgi:hypothetical protein
VNGVARVVLFVAGAAVVVATLLSAVRTVLVPRATPSALTSLVFVNSRALFNVFVRRMESYEERDQLLAYYAPVTLAVLPGVWLLTVLAGYTGLFWAAGVRGFGHALNVSGSSLLTLGFERPHGAGATALAVSEAAIGVGLVALLITFLPSMYAAFQRRESMVAMLETRAGSPPTAVNMIIRYKRIEGLDRLEMQWPAWEAWFADLEESHTSLAALSFFRSPRSHRSWVTAAGAVLDSASLAVAAVDASKAPQAQLCIRAGYVALRAIADFFRIEYNPDPQPTDAIAVTRDEFDAAYDELHAAGVPMKRDREQAWRDFAGWRVNYDGVLLELAALTMAPIAPWTSDRSPPYRRPPVIRGARRMRARR